MSPKKHYAKGLELRWLVQLVLSLGCCLALNLRVVPGTHQAVNRVLCRDGGRLQVTPKRCHLAYIKGYWRNRMDVALTVGMPKLCPKQAARRCVRVDGYAVR